MAEKDFDESIDIVEEGDSRKIIINKLSPCEDDYNPEEYDAISKNEELKEQYPALTGDELFYLGHCDIVNLIGRKLKLIHVGSAYRTNCPFHFDLKKSFHVLVRRNLFRCYSCGEKGNSFDFCKKMGIGHSEAMQLIKKSSSIKNKKGESVGYSRAES
ncbi:MAG TPA: CHC2 zinc finger domain-containing protein [Rummeliibacillus sp.]|nr:CHC2 zinc finger domain-containing protein [Rummeliibacillus sp.]